MRGTLTSNPALPRDRESLPVLNTPNQQDGQLRKLSPGKASMQKVAVACPLAPVPHGRGLRTLLILTPTSQDHSVPGRAWLKTARRTPGQEARTYSSREHAHCALRAEGGSPRRTSLRRRQIPVGRRAKTPSAMLDAADSP